ncbi:FG-GAP repeat domain-containing protein [Chondromyces apiculatus]|uniref:FG-GAP repeat domain-containing protein n=1 Tax=Chondromyces apiculatus TaxID=51 RepID=UPI000693E442|nr:VCBS repeat-containing protein [Chondromyces apiculatus]
MQRPDLARQLRVIEQETAALGLTAVLEMRGRLPRGGGEVVARGYEGGDRLGRRTTAVRAVSSRGVVLTLGPLSLGDLDRSQATELLAHPLLGEAATHTDEESSLATASLTDLNGDSLPDVVLRSETGTLEVWALHPFSATRYPVELSTLPTLAIDADDDGQLDLAGRPLPVEGDLLAPDLLEVATFERGRYTFRSEAARALSARHAARHAGIAAAPSAGAPPPLPPASTASTSEDASLRLRSALERAWYTMLAGRPRAEVLAALDKERIPPDLQASFAAHRARIASLGPVATAKEKTPTEKATGTPDRK